MRVINQSWDFLEILNGENLLRNIEIAGRTCYKSEDNITPESSREFVKKLINSGHHAMIEHGSISIKIVTDRGVTHEIVRHRVASYAQESTRYCNYSKDKFGNEVTFIRPVEFVYGEDCVMTDLDQCRYDTWCSAMSHSEKMYLLMLKEGASPQLARSVLPNSLKTELVMTANPREWRHFFELRCSKLAHPQMRDLACSILDGFKSVVPILFDDINYEL